MRYQEYAISLIKKISEILSTLTIEQVTLISILITFLIYTLGKRIEIQLKKHEMKKENYIKFLQLHIKLFKAIREKKNIKVSSFDEKFFDVGSSLLTYGSKKVYRKYLFYREVNEHPIAQGNKYFQEGELNLYLLGGILKQIRKEISLERYNNITETEALSFFVNGFANKSYRKN